MTGDSGETHTGSPTGRRRRFGGRVLRRAWQPLLWGVFAASVVGFPLLLGVGDASPAGLPDWIPTTPAALIATHALLVGVAVPNTVFCVAAGALFGLGWGALIASVGTWLGSLTAFLLARLLLRRPVSRLLRRFPQAEAVFLVLGAGGTRVVLLTRLSPLIPFAVQNYGWAVTPVRFRPYALGSLLAAPVGATLFAHLGAAGTAGVSLAAGQWSVRAAVTVVGVVATLFLVHWISRAAATALDREIEPNPPEGRPPS